MEPRVCRRDSADASFPATPCAFSRLQFQSRLYARDRRFTSGSPTLMKLGGTLV